MGKIDFEVSRTTLLDDPLSHISPLDGNEIKLLQSFFFDNDFLPRHKKVEKEKYFQLFSLVIKRL